MLTIGQLARECGVSVETVRFYERRGLVAQPPRPQAGFRKYPTNAVRRVQFIQRSKALGFSLKEIRELLLLRVDSAVSCMEVKRYTEEKIGEIERKIQTLDEMRKALARLAAACRGEGPTGQCPILDALEHGGLSSTKERGWIR